MVKLLKDFWKEVKRIFNVLCLVWMPLLCIYAIVFVAGWDNPASRVFAVFFGLVVSEIVYKKLKQNE